MSQRHSKKNKNKGESSALTRVLEELRSLRTEVKAVRQAQRDAAADLEKGASSSSAGSQLDTNGKSLSKATSK